MNKLVILGAGGYGCVVKDIAEQLGYETIVVLDDNISEHPLASCVDFLGESIEFIPAFGNNEFRMEWIRRIKEAGGQLATLIHPTAYVSPKAFVTPGTVVLPHAIINTDVVIGQGCILNLGAMVDHGCVVEEGVHVCLGAMIKAENRVKALSKIEAGEVIEARIWPVGEK